MRTLSSQEERIEELAQHFKEPSFKAFINWKGQLCSISNFYLMKSVVLPSLSPEYEITDFVEDLKDLKLRFRLKKNLFQIIFPKIHEIVREQTKSFEVFSDKLGQIESKQLDLTQALVRTQNKIQRAILIYERIKEELRNSRERQVSMLRESGHKFESEGFVKKTLN